MSTRVRLVLLNTLVIFAVVGAAVLLLNTPVGARSPTSLLTNAPLHCRMLPDYFMRVIDRPAARDGYLVVCFGDPLARGPIMDFRIVR